MSSRRGHDTCGKHALLMSWLYPEEGGFGRATVTITICAELREAP
jgi:hypothetical protein